MDLRKEIQVALNNCQPNTNRVDKIEAIAQKYAKFYHALQLQQTGVIVRSEQLKAVEKLKDFAYEVCPLHREEDLQEILNSL
jgi:hypothetical protein